MKHLTGRGLRMTCAMLLFVPLAGCIGIYDNTDLFLNDPGVGTPEIEVLKSFGTPAFVSDSGSDKVLTYKVRKSQYLVLIGLYSGHDLIVQLKDGLVSETHRTRMANRFTVLQPVPWTVAD